MFQAVWSNPTSFTIVQHDLEGCIVGLVFWDRPLVVINQTCNYHHETIFHTFHVSLVFRHHEHHRRMEATTPLFISPLLPMPSILNVGVAWCVFYCSNAAHRLFNGRRSGRFDDTKRGGLSMVREVILHLPSPAAILPASPKSNLSKGWIVLRFWCRERGAWVCRGHFWLENGFLWQYL